MIERRGKVQTVLGLIDPGELGRTMTHEHLLIDLNVPGARDDPGDELSLRNLGRNRRYSNRNPFILRLDSEEVATGELAEFKAAGGGSIVDATSIGLIRRPEALRRISRTVGVHVVMGCSYYVADYHPPEVGELSERGITAGIVRDLTEGVEGTSIRAGVIGEVGLVWPVHKNEEKVLRASAVAQQETGAPLMIHPGRGRAAPLDAIRIVREAGCDPSRTIMSHIDRTLFDHEEMTALAETGCYLEFDLFGQESSYYPLAPIDMPNDATRVDHIIRLIAAGYRDQLVVAQDICHKHGLKTYGGDGYSHILENMIPVMKRKGMSDGDIDAILADNPKRILAFV